MRRVSSAQGQENVNQITRPVRARVSAAPPARSTQCERDDGTGQRQRLVGDGEPQVDRRGDAVELAGARRRVVGAAGRLRDRLERVRVKRGEQVVAVGADRGARGGAHADGIDVYLGLLGDRGGGAGDGGAGAGPCAGVARAVAGRESGAAVLPVGQHHDRGRRPVADVRRVAARVERDRPCGDRGKRGENGQSERGAASGARRRTAARASRDRCSGPMPLGRPPRRRPRRSRRCPAGR